MICIMRGNVTLCTLFCAILLFTTLWTVIACKDPLSDDSNLSVPDDAYLISKESAIEIAYDFYQKESNSNPVRSSSSDVKSCFSICDSDILHAHVVNFDDGTVIVAGDKRMNPILGYTENGNISSDSSEYPTGFKIWLEDLKRQTYTLRETCQDAGTTSSISNPWESTMNSITTRVVPLDTTLPPLVDTTVGPLIATSWHEIEPYNTYLPPLLDTLGSAVLLHQWAGSSTVAIAQLMYYYSIPVNLNWSDMPLSISSSDTTCYASLFNLYLEIFNKTSSYKGFNHTYQRTYVKEKFKLNDFLTSQYGFTSAKQKTYSKYSGYSIIENELLDYQRPVILSGTSSQYGWGRQYWLCDGVHEYDSVHYLDDGTQEIYGYLYFHHNWGTHYFPSLWLGHSVFTAGTVWGNSYAFSNNMRIVYEIIP